jgi:hypothetical protein
MSKYEKYQRRGGKKPHEDKGVGLPRAVKPSVKQTVKISKSIYLRLRKGQWGREHLCVKRVRNMNEFRSIALICRLKRYV